MREALSSPRGPAPRRGRAAIAFAGAAAIYWVAGRLALWLAIPPGYATAVWPAAGLALVCVLAWGPRAALGVALGSCLVNLGTSLHGDGDGDGALAVVRACGIAGAIGAGAAVQAALGAALIRRRVGFPSGLSDERDILWFIVLGGPLACLASATIGVTTLALAGAMPWSGFAFSWWTWWVGDTIGVLVFAPLALLTLPHTRAGWHAVWRRRRGIVGIPLVLGFATVTVLFVHVSGWERARLRTDFERRAAPVEAMLESQLSKYQEVVTALASFFDASVDVTRGEFHAFCARALKAFPAILAMSWNPRVPAAQRAGLEQRARQDGIAGFAFTEKAPGGVQVAGDRAAYVPVYYVEPVGANLATLGFDTASDPVRRATFERIRPGDVAASQRIDLLQDEIRDARGGGGEAVAAGVLLVAPVPVIDGAGSAGAAAIRGYTVVAFRLRDMVEAALRGIDHAGMDIALVDRSADPASALLFALDPGAVRATAPLVFPIAVGDRQWQLEISPTAAFTAAQRSWQAWTVLAAGLLFVGLLGIFLLVTTGRTYRLHEGAERFRALVEASAQIVWTTDAAGEVSEDSPSWRAFTGQSLEQCRGSRRLDAIHPDDRAAVIARYRAAVAARSAIDTEYRLRHASGEWRWTAARAVPLIDVHGELRGWVMSNTDITERRRAETEKEDLLAQLRKLNAGLEQRVQTRTRELTAALREREVLLQEIHHRVKNNLQVISSLISMQVRKLDRRADREALEECQTRVQAIALIHDKLYQSSDYAHVPFSEYTRALISNVFHTMGVSSDSVAGGAAGAIALDMAIDDVAVPVDKAIPCGLVLNELITNALKHAFKDGRRGELRVELGKRGGRVRLAVRDNGVGLPRGLDVRGTRSFGLQLVGTLVEQLGATLTVTDSGGACFELEFGVDDSRRWAAVADSCSDLEHSPAPG
jgi:PAS domain S-box-containing protein